MRNANGIMRKDKNDPLLTSFKFSLRKEWSLSEISIKALHFTTACNNHERIGELP
jgi:hypothetical protein